MGLGGRRAQCLGQAECQGSVGVKAVFGDGWDRNRVMWFRSLSGSPGVGSQ